MGTLYEYQFAFNRHRGKRSMHVSDWNFPTGDCDSL